MTLLAALYYGCSALFVGGAVFMYLQSSRESWAGRPLSLGLFRSGGVADGVRFLAARGKVGGSLIFESSAASDVELFIGTPFPPDRPYYAYAGGWERVPPPPELPEWNGWGRPAHKAALLAAALPAGRRDWKRLELRRGRLRLTYWLDHSLAHGELEACAAEFKAMARALGLAA